MSALHHALRTALVVVSGLTLQAALATDAHACSALSCRSGALLPVHMGKLPANAVELFWSPPAKFSGPDAGVGAVHLYEGTGSTRKEVAIDLVAENGLFRVKPKTAIAAGTELSFESDLAPCLSDERTSFQLSVSAAAPKPTHLGTLSIASLGPVTMQLWVNTGECTAPFPVYSAQLALALDAEAMPYADVLRHSLIVDGVERHQYSPYPDYPKFPVTDLGGGLKDTLFTVCGAAPSRGQTSTAGDKPGVYKVQWLTKLQDGTELRSNELSVELKCPEDTSDAGVSDAAVVQTDSGANLAQDAGATAADANSERGVDASVQGSSAMSAPATTTTDEGRLIDEPNANGGCALSGSREHGGSSSALSWLGGLLALLFVRRRRA